MRTRASSSQGFSLIEVIIVVALIAFVYTVAIPQFSMRTGAEVATKLNQLAGDVRAAYDLAVLSNKTYRMVFLFSSGDYWLEEADRSDVYLGHEKLDRDPTESEEKEEQLAFEAKMREYEELAGSAVVDPDDDKEIPPSSPLLEAKDRLKGPVWTRVNTMEWSQRSLGPNLMIQKMQAEHHGRAQDFTELGTDGRGIIYFFPSGYVEKAFMVIAYKKEEFVVDESETPYTLVTDPYEGTAAVQPGDVPVDVHDDRAAE